MSFNWTLTIFLSAFLVMVGCTKKNKSEYGLNPEETLSVTLHTEPPTLDWTKATDTTSSNILYNIMDGLVGYNLNDPELSLKKNLATDWSSNKDATKWTFKIRKGVKWTDGVELTAQHFVDGWIRLLEPETASVYSYFLYGLKGAKEFNEGKIKDSSKVGVKVNAQGDLEVQLVSPMSYFPKLLSHASTYPIRLDVIKKHGNKWTDPGNIVTLGAYTLKTWDHDKAVILERNEGYFGAPAKIKYVLGYIINERSTSINLFESGKIDHVDDLPAIELAKLKEKPEYTSKGLLAIYYLGFNTKRKPFDNKKFRRAVSLAIDREQIIKMLKADHKPLRGWVPEGMFGHENNIGQNFNPVKAKELMAEAGYADPSKLPTIYYGYNTNENHQRIAENVQAQLKKNLGIDIEIKNEEWKVYLSTIKTNPAHIYRMGWQADFPDPDNFLNMLLSDSDQNHTGWGNDLFDKYIKQASKSLDSNKRKEIYIKAQKILVEEDFPVYPVYSMVRHHLISKRTKNFPINSLDEKQYKDVELSKSN